MARRCLVPMWYTNILNKSLNLSIKFYISTLGCKVNQYESQALREAWSALGWQECASPKHAELLLVNSCAVTASAVADVRAQVRRLHALAPQAQILIMGCSAEVQSAEMQSLPGVHKVIRAAEKDDFYRNPVAYFKPAPELAPESAREGGPVLAPALSPDLLLDLPLGLFSEFSPELPPELNVESNSKQISPQLLSESSSLATAKPGVKRLYPPFAVSGYNRARAVIKVQDGCSHFCTYCIVPLARGRAVSRSPEDVLQEVQRLLKAGFTEITLSGINLSQYAWQNNNDDTQRSTGGFNQPPTQESFTPSAIFRPFIPGKKRLDFWDLLVFLEQHLTASPNHNAENAASLNPSFVSSPFRLRISSLEPGQLDQRALNILSQSKLICPQLHISLQSGSPGVLKRMGRGHYNPTSLLEFCVELKKKWPQFGLGADLLVGFPGETDEEFEQTKSLVQALPFTYAHVFPFSARPGTKAASFPHAVPKPVRTKRAASLRKIIEKKKQAFLEFLLAQGKPLHMVLESRENGLGVCEYYVECCLQEVPPEAQPKDCLKVMPIALQGDRLLVKACC